NTVTTFNPAFRINTWTAGTVPEFVEVDNQVLNRGYQYNVYLNTAGAGGGELVLQFNKTLPPGNHVFYISHKNGLAVALRSFEAKGGDGVDTLTWITESEFENLGYHVYRRVAPADAQIDTSLAEGGEVAGAGIANALMNAARTELAKRAEAKLAKAQALASDAGDSSGALDTLPSQELSPEELAALGYARITPKLIPGAKNGSSASTLEYRYIDRTAAFGTAYEYLLEAADFNGRRVQYGPRTARPSNTLNTELYSNYPNPFNPITTLRFSLKEKLKVSLIIYDSKGRLVRTLVRPEKAMLPGKYRLIWDARDEGGIEAPSGQYFYRFTAGRYVKTRKMILVK
ncbi:MAG: Por secretion system C-terminal sorting protein, partial [Fibrobacteres bacterium]|nr:Por secretion system C-terminal sorting protein [Fibrobacterota bacterium]